MNNGQPIGGFLHLGKHTKKTENFSFCSFKFQMTAEIVSLAKGQQSRTHLSCNYTFVLLL